jgi:hypothetical protein
MRTYLTVTAGVFIIITGGLVALLLVEKGAPLHEVDFLVTVALSVSLAIWAIILLRRMPRAPRE